MHHQNDMYKDKIDAWSPVTMTFLEANWQAHECSCSIYLAANRFLHQFLHLHHEHRGHIWVVLILSPLKILQRDQVCTFCLIFYPTAKFSCQRQRFKKMRIPAHAVNGDTWSSTLATVIKNSRVLQFPDWSKYTRRLMRIDVEQFWPLPKCASSIQHFGNGWPQKRRQAISLESIV